MLMLHGHSEWAEVPEKEKAVAPPASSWAIPIVCGKPRKPRPTKRYVSGFLTVMPAGAPASWKASWLPGLGHRSRERPSAVRNAGAGAVGAVGAAKIAATELELT